MKFLFRSRSKSAVCPYCKGEIEENDQLCGQCDTSHHADCMIENKGCAIWGCEGVVQIISPKGSCSVCGGFLLMTASYCLDCGIWNHLQCMVDNPCIHVVERGEMMVEHRRLRKERGRRPRFIHEVLSLTLMAAILSGFVLNILSHFLN